VPGKNCRRAIQKDRRKAKPRPHVAIIELPIDVFQVIGNSVNNALYQLTEHAKHSDELGEHFSRLEKTLKETISSASTRTYAQMATTSTPVRSSIIEPQARISERPNEIRARNLERKVQERHDKAKFEVTLTVQGGNPDARDQLAQQTHAEITAKLQQTAENQLKTSYPAIHGIDKLKSQDIRIHCSTVEEAEQLRKIEWDKAYNGLTVRRAKFGVELPGVPKDMVDPKNLQDSELIKQLEKQNPGLEIAGLKPLRRKLRDDAQDYSLVMFFTTADMADHSIKHGFYINHRWFHPNKYMLQFQLVQCFKCQQFGHHASKCRSLHDVCAKCSEHHPTSQCHSETHKCAGCKGEHPAWHQNCPNKIQAIQSLAIRKRQASAYFNE